MTAAAETPAAWEHCRISSCRRHRDCMYFPCRSTAPLAPPPPSSAGEEAALAAASQAIWSAGASRLQRPHDADDFARAALAALRLHLDTERAARDAEVWRMACAVVAKWFAEIGWKLDEDDVPAVIRALEPPQQGEPE